MAGIPVGPFDGSGFELRSTDGLSDGRGRLWSSVECWASRNPFRAFSSSANSLKNVLEYFENSSLTLLSFYDSIMQNKSVKSWPKHAVSNMILEKSCWNFFLPKLIPFLLELFLHFQNLKNRCQLPRLPCLIYIIYLPYELLKYLIDLELMPNRDFPITLNSQNSLFLTVVFALLLNLKRMNNWYW